MHRPTLKARLRYAFDRIMDKGVPALVGLLGAATLLVILLGGGLIALAHIAPEGGQPLSLLEGSWQALMRAFDAGNLQGDEGWPYRLVMLAMTLAGIFILSTLIGILSAGVNNRLEQLRKGRSQIIEDGHTIILNWSPSIFDVLSELATANASQRRAVVAVLADKDKVEMEDAIAARLPDLQTTRVICRSGDPTDLFDLQIVSPQTSRSIVLLSPETAEDPDSHVVKTLLALTNDPDRREEPYRIAAEVRDRGNADVALAAGGREVQLVVPDDLIGRIVVHSSRQAGLSGVYAELLSFDGVEIYTGKIEPALTGLTYGEALSRYRTCALIGLETGAGEVRLNPPMDTVIAADDRPIVIAEDDSSVRLDGDPPPVDEVLLRPGVAHALDPERVLVLGWNRRGAIIAEELARYMPTGSDLLVAGDAPFLDSDVAALSIPPATLRVEVRAMDASRRAAVQALRPETFHHIIVLSDSDHRSPRAADTRTLVTLLHLRRTLDEAGARTSVVSEMVDVRNQRLAEVSRADDFVVSNRLASLMLAQASEQDEVSAIFADLLGKGGSEIVMRSAGEYIAAGASVSFYSVLEAAKRRGETAIGWCCGRGADAVVLNPDKAEARTFGDNDRIVVVARD